MEAEVIKKNLIETVLIISVKVTHNKGGERERESYSRKNIASAH